MKGASAMHPQDHYRKLEQMYRSGPINAYYQPVLHVEEGRAEVIMPVRREFWHFAAAVHGSVYFKALDDAAYFAVNSLVYDVFVLTVSFTVYLTRPISQGEMRATGRVVDGHKRLYVAEAELMDAEGRRIACGSGTFVPSHKPLSVTGYHLK